MRIRGGGKQVLEARLAMGNAGLEMGEGSVVF